MKKVLEWYTILKQYASLDFEEEEEEEEEKSEETPAEAQPQEK